MTGTTASSGGPSLALCVICHERPDELRAALASAPGFDEVVVLDMASEPPLAPEPGVTWLREERNAGVAAGRNRQAAAATADVLVFLDDDAVFASPDPAAAIRAVLREHPDVAGLAFRIVRADGQTVKAEYPFRGHAVDAARARPCAYFLGGAAAVRRDAFLAAGGFDDRYLYSTEELDLSFALARRGGRFFYAPSVVVEHRPSARGRSLDPEVPALRLRNRLLLVRRHLPAPVAVVHATAWAARTFTEAARAGRVGPWLRAWRGLREPVDRAPLDGRTLRELHRLGGRVLW
ncbi:MAG TPA: glycosyltransferase [Acidimicrobiia bacterium]|nr:glycosyltransferase [Acidimicrobiia bacterium]